MKNIVTLENGVKMDTFGSHIVVSSDFIEITLDSRGNLVSIVSNDGDELYYRNDEMVRSADKKTLQYNDLRRQLSDILHMLGIPANLRGYEYLMTAILLVYNDKSYMHAMVARLYPEVARVHNVGSYTSIERCIRHAIEISWERAEVKTLNKIFSWSTSRERGKATNSEFIAMLADYLRKLNE